MQPSTRRGALSALAALAFGATTERASAQVFPNQPIHILVGFNAGSTGDLIARALSKPLSEQLGQPVIVENRAGAGSAVAAGVVARAAPDGYTLLLAASAHASNAALKPQLPFDPVKDFAWVSLLTAYPIAIVVRADSPIQSFQDFLQRIKADPKRYNYAAGTGTAMHIVGEWLMAESGGNAVRIPFNGGLAAMTELLAGRIDVVFDSVIGVAPMIRDGRLRALAFTSAGSYADFPDVPPVARFLPGLVLESWQAIAAPAATPPAIVDRLNREIQKALEQPDIRDRFQNTWGVPVKASTPAQMRARVDQDIQKLRQIVKARNLQAD